jgi:UDPglucose 6-dehydrogenase
MKIGVIGNGFVGKATCILQNKDVDIIVYDLNPQLCDPPGSTINDLKSCDLIFVSVPTPMNKDGSCHVEIVESVVKNLRQNNIINEPNNFVVIRSTVIPGTSDNLGCYFMPEFLTEKDYLKDFKNCKDWLFGLKGTDYDQFFMNKINKLFTLGKINGCIKSNSTSFVLNKEAEMIKYFRNCFLALKISFCNEIYDYCQLQNINYEIVRHQATKDDRIGWSHSCVPGHDEKRGYGGTCLPKDTKALLYSMKNLGSSSYIFDAMDARNDNIDRIDQDWASNIGRSVLG